MEQQVGGELTNTGFADQRVSHFHHRRSWPIPEDGNLLR